MQPQQPCRQCSLPARACSRAAVQAGRSAKPPCGPPSQVSTETQPAGTTAFLPVRLVASLLRLASVMHCEEGRAARSGLGGGGPQAGQGTQAGTPEPRRGSGCTTAVAVRRRLGATRSWHDAHQCVGPLCIDVDCVGRHQEHPSARAACAGAVGGAPVGGTPCIPGVLGAGARDALRGAMRGEGYVMGCCCWRMLLLADAAAAASQEGGPWRFCCSVRPFRPLVQAHLIVGIEARPHLALCAPAQQRASTARVVCC